MKLEDLENIEGYHIDKGFLCIKLISGDHLRINFNSIEAIKKQFAISGVSISFKASIEAQITELEQKLVSISKDVEMSFTQPENWKKEMHLINGKIDGLKLALNDL